MYNLTFDPTLLVELLSPYIMTIGIASIVFGVLLTITMVVIVKE